jgi:hypothetical protein
VSIRISTEPRAEPAWQAHIQTLSLCLSQENLTAVTDAEIDQGRQSKGTTMTRKNKISSRHQDYKVLGAD